MTYHCALIKILWSYLTGLTALNIMNGEKEFPKLTLLIFQKTRAWVLKSDSKSSKKISFKKNKFMETSIKS